MHELGHNFKLEHGGGDATEKKPNYLSAMNYAFPDGIPQVISVNSMKEDNWRIDYSLEELKPLNESSLNENDGIGSKRTFNGYYDVTRFKCPPGGVTTHKFWLAKDPIDWNCNSVTTNTGITVDINGSGFPTDTLIGYNDWEKLEFDFQKTENFKDGVHFISPTQVELTYPDYAETPGVADVSTQYVLTPTDNILVAGQTSQVVFDVANSGFVPASDVALVSDMPAGLTLAAVTSDATCAQPNRTLTCTVPTLLTNNACVHHA
ncbi:MAG: hypothetical protein HC853_05000, partial [Anaerolineae bacterium]|nr:hypothetical protein [Anaerolineae bacterium]